MNNKPIINQEELVEMIKTKLESKPYKASYSHFSEAPAQTESAAYVLILGAGFSYGIVPLVNELMQQTIGDYYYPDQDQSSVERPARVLRKDSERTSGRNLTKQQRERSCQSLSWMEEVSRRIRVQLINVCSLMMVLMCSLHKPNQRKGI